MSPHQLHRIARKFQLEWRQEIAQKRRLAYAIAISLVAIVGLIVTNPHW
jgi:hypothetical protein